MADYADVHSLDAIRDFRAALLTFADDAKIALGDVEFDIRRLTEWLTNEQPLYWKGEIKRWEQKLTEAKAELARKKMGKFLDQKPDTSQEEKKVKHCLMMVEEAHRKLSLCKHLLPELQHAIQEYRGQSMPLLGMVDNDIPKGAFRLDRMVEALENYLRLMVPETPRPAAGGVGVGDEAMTRPVGTTSTEKAARDPKTAESTSEVDSPDGAATEFLTSTEGDDADERQRRGE